MEREYLHLGGEDHEGIAEQPAQRKKKSKANKRRFSDEQIRLLESIFESETKLEPRKKLQLARELGLQPRQVAIWFQNRRARWKSKQIEQDYRTLRDNYDNLASRFESLKKEKQSLIQQLQKLSELVAEPHDMNKEGKGMDGSSKSGGSEHGDYNKCEAEAEAEADAEAQPNVQLQQAAGLEDRGFLGLQIENERDMKQGGEYLSMGGEGYRNESPAAAAAAAAASPEKLYGFDSATLFDHSCSNSQWLNFWI